MQDILLLVQQIFHKYSVFENVINEFTNRWNQFTEKYVYP